MHTGEINKYFGVNQTFYLAAVALVIGLLSGLGAVLFYYLISFFNQLFFVHLNNLIEPIGPLRVSLYGGIGGLLVGPMVYFLAREAKGHGVPEVMYAAARQGGRIRPRVVFIKALASSITIGSGGSAGREGPIAQIGAALGSTIGQWIRLSEKHLVTMVACGAGAGIAATFNTPFAGAIFALEVVLGEFSAETFGLVVISSVSASFLSRSLMGNAPTFIVAPYDLVNPTELLLYLLLGVAAAVVALFYSRLLYWTEDLFEDMHKVPEWVHPALGGILFGLIGIFLPQTLGRGEQVMTQILRGDIQIAGLLAVLCIAKLVTTSLTIGSGGSGGVFFPGLFIGACLGGSLGSVYHQLLPGVTSGSGAYAMVGMGALFAGMTQAPITAILMLFEMTQDYRIILPLMLACGVATLLARFLSRETIYTMKLARRGIFLQQGRDSNVMHSVLVKDAMTMPVIMVNIDDNLEEVIRKMQQSRHNGFPVIDAEGSLVGMITLEDIRKIDLPVRLKTRVRDAMSPDPVVAIQQETLEEVSRKFAQKDIGRVPVIEGAGSKKVVGIITRSDILNSYNWQLLENEKSET